MNRKLLFLSLTLASMNLQAQQWPPVQQEAYPATRWWWLGSAVDKDNITYNLQEFSKAGIKGVEITPIYGVQGNDNNNITFLSSKWMEMLKYTQAEGKRLGVEIDMNTGTGWPFGGPNIDTKNAATKAIFQSYKVKGGEKTDINIEVNDKRQEPVAILSRVMAYNNKGKCFDITSSVNNGRLLWNAPKGEWEIIVHYIGKTFQKVKRAAPGGEGYVLNHFDKESVRLYLDNFDKAFKKNGVAYPHTFFNDSYEVYGADWTPDFLEQFYKRRGYKLEEHFPEFLSKERNEKTARIICDYRETISDLLIENFTTQWTAWANSNGSITRNQAHGSPANLIDTYASVDIPECEGFGLSQFHINGLRQDSLTKKNDSDFSMLKYASSAAHITGKRFTSSETFTWLTEHFRTSLAQCKPDMDLMFVSGVNHMFFHGSTYSPKEAKWPGWRFYASIDMSPTNSIWRDAPSFFDYIARCQSFLQMGKPDNDFLVYLPIYDMWQEQPGRLLLFTIHEMAERAPKFIETVNSISKCGYDMDYISDSFINSLSCQNGNLITKGGTSYKAIIIPDVKFMPPHVLAHLIELAKNGATLIFTEDYPKDVPGYGNLKNRYKQMSDIHKLLPQVKSFGETVVTNFSKGRIITGSDYISVLSKTGIQSEEMSTLYGLKYIRRTNENGHHYFISALQNKGFEGWLPLSIQESTIMIFNPITGEKGLASTRTVNGKKEIYLQLRSGESIILQSFNKPIKNVEKWQYISEKPGVIDINHGWKLHFKESEPKIDKTFDIDTPSSWTLLDDSIAKKTMATGVYTNTIDVNKANTDDWILDLADVRESARVYINHNYVGTLWAVPYRLKVGKWLKEGNNIIEIEVTNLPANRISEMDRKGEKWRIFNEINVVNLNYKDIPYNNWQPMPSGLNGNVKLIPIDYRS